jgi:hypothetical protein
MASDSRHGRAHLLRSPTRQIKGDAMRNHPKVTKSESHVDAWAIMFIVVLVIGAAAFWMTHQ